MTPVGSSMPHDFASFLSSSLDSMKPSMSMMGSATTAGQMKPLTLTDAERMIPLSVLTTAGVNSNHHSSYFNYAAAYKKQQQQQLQNKKPKRRVRRRKWRKPKDKPKRPLSAYNLFFRDEREQTNQNQPTQKLGFAAMGRMVASKWKNLEPDKRAIYEERAKKERNKYFDALAEWRKEKEKEKKQREQEEADAAAKLDSVQLDDDDFYDTFSTGDDDLVTEGLMFEAENDGLDEKGADTTAGTNPFANTFDSDNEEEDSNKKTRDFLANKLQMALDCSVKEEDYGEANLSLMKDKLLTDDIAPSSPPPPKQDKYNVTTTKRESSSLPSPKRVTFEDDTPPQVTTTTKLPHPFCAEYGCMRCPQMKRILKTFEVLRHTIDDEFVTFMGNLDWSHESLSSTSVSSESSSSQDEEETEEEVDGVSNIKMEEV